jgi:SAM-dependent methyltransferase
MDRRPVPARLGPSRPPLLDVLMCVYCRGRLTSFGDGLSCFGCGTTYPATRGVPVLTLNQHQPEVRSDDHGGHQIPPDLRDRLAALDGYWLNLGAGATEMTVPNCIEVEYQVFRNTTVVADPARLPFIDECVSAVVSFNTLEHLAEPGLAAAEIYRVLAPGGEVVIQTAFLPPLRANRSHCYNATETGIRHWFKRFDIEACSVPANFNPLFSLAWLASELLRLSPELGEDALGYLERSTLFEWSALWREPERRAGPLWELMQRLPDDAQRRMAAGFELRARKPSG